MSHHDRFAVSALASVLVLAAGAALAWAAEPAADQYGAATAALFKKAPVIDGKIEPGEWDGAVRVTGFQALTGGMQECRTGTTWFGFTADRLYIAMVSEYPPDGKEHSSGTGRDRDYVGDESVEIWLDPCRDNRAKQEGDLRFYQLNANAAGGIYDLSFDPKKGPDTGWNGNWEYKNTVDHEKHLWTMELSLPFADLGWKSGQAVGKTLGVLVARNFKGPWDQATWFHVCGAFVNWYRYAAIRLTADSPTVQITSLGEELHKPHLQLRATVTNPGPARKAKVSLVVSSSDMPEARKQQVLLLPAGGVVEFAFDDTPGRLHEAAQHGLAFDVTSPDGNDVYMHYNAKWEKAPEKKWTYRLGPDPDAAMRFAYYPSYKFVRVLTDARELGKDVEANSHRAQVVIRTEDGKEVAVGEMKWDKPPCTQEFPVGELADGNYVLTVTVDGWDKPMTGTFSRKHFAFEGNKLGVTEEVLPPFEPVKVEGDRVSVVYRQHQVDGLGLWKSIQAAGNVSAGGPAELLAGPMAIKVDDGQALQGAGKFVEVKPASAVYEGAADHPAVHVQTRCTTEMDGCMKVELTLAPGSGKQELKSLWLEIPLRDKLMPLWHVTTAGLRINPAGPTPAGEGVVWDSSKFPDGYWFGDFKCYLWLGAEERGLCWFADNDAGWELSTDAKGQPNRPCQQLIRKGDVLTLRVNLVQKPITLAGPRKIVFGLMATPAKPMRPDWRLTGLTVRSEFSMGYATPASYCAKAPWGEDFTVADWCYAKRTGKGEPNKADVEAWKERNFPQDMDPKFREGVIKLALQSFVGRFRTGQAYWKMYFDEFHTTTMVEPETHVFQDEWIGGWHRKLLDHATKEEHKMWGIGVAGIVPSHRDFACYYAAEWIKRGIGCYFDNAFPTRAYDTLTTSAYKLPNGQVQPSAGMWARRDYLRRIWTLHRQLAPADAAPAMMIHMTNTRVTPYMVWNDEDLDLEWKFGPEPQQSKWSPAFLRAETLGRQGGNVPWALDKIMDAKTPEEDRKAVDTRFGTMMVHEIRWWDVREQDVARYKIMTDFGYGDPNCRVYNYWDEGYPVKADEDDKTLLLKRGDELFLVICTWKAAPHKASFALDTKALGLTPQAAADAEQDAMLASLKDRLEKATASRTNRANQLRAAQAATTKAADANARDAAAGNLKTAQANVTSAEAAVANLEATLQAEQQKYANGPIAWDAASATLTIPLDAYGVRLVRLK